MSKTSNVRRLVVKKGWLGSDTEVVEAEVVFIGEAIIILQPERRVARFELEVDAIDYVTKINAR